MNSKILLLTICSTLLFAACSKEKDGQTDILRYENLLNSDYKSALSSHESLQSGTVSATDHSTHHSGAGASTFPDQVYLKKMFAQSDSMFSEHFYTFCIDMIKNGAMTASSVMGMKGMMEDGSMTSMMNGGGMMGHSSADEMITYMESIHQSDADHMQMDSLMLGRMDECKMMTSAGNIKSLVSNMQLLRKEHKLTHD